MRKCIASGLFSVVAAFLIAVSGEGVVAQEKKGNAPKFLYGHEFQVRTGKKPDFNKDTPRKGIEFYLEESLSAVIAISETGSLAIAPAGQIGTDHRCKWLTGHDLGARKIGEVEFTQRTKKYGVELYRDLGSNRLVYICESGSIAFAPVPAGLVTEKGPRYHHASEMRIREAGETNFERAKKIGMEVFKDENTGGLIYITETGGIATSPAPATPPDPLSPAPTKALYAWDLRVRGADESEFSDKTKHIGVEIFEDPNAGNQLIYITETGCIAIAPNPGMLSETKGMTWKPGMTLKARKAGEKDFKNAKKYGIEVFVDNRTGNLVFIDDTGSIAVLPKQ